LYFSFSSASSSFCSFFDSDGGGFPHICIKPFEIIFWWASTTAFTYVKAYHSGTKKSGAKDQNSNEEVEVKISLIKNREQL
jgi:hypothetical protein